MMQAQELQNRPVRSLQTMLQTLSRVFPDIPEVLPDGVYGCSTQDAVSAFQSRAALPVTGVADHDTWNQLVSAYLRHAPRVLPPEPLQLVWQPMQTISPGEENLHLYLIQAMLAALHRQYPALPLPGVSGFYDETTKAAVLQLQALFGFAPSAVIDQSFWSCLAKLYALQAGDGTIFPQRDFNASGARFLL